MASLTTVYIVSLVLASISGIGSAFIGHSFYSWKGGAEPVSQEVSQKPAQELKQEYNLKTLLEKEVGDKKRAEIIFEFIETPVMEWKKIAPTFREIVKKYSASMTHPDQNKCSAKLLEVCNMVSTKFSHIRNYIINETPDSLGDQTAEAFELLKSTE